MGVSGTAALHPGPEAQGLTCVQPAGEGQGAVLNVEGEVVDVQAAGGHHVEGLVVLHLTVMPDIDVGDVWRLAHIHAGRGKGFICLETGSRDLYPRFTLLSNTTARLKMQLSLTRLLHGITSFTGSFSPRRDPWTKKWRVSTSGIEKEKFFKRKTMGSWGPSQLSLPLCESWGDVLRAQQ